MQDIGDHFKNLQFSTDVLQKLVYEDEKGA